jgi:biotin carboxyl carrier protein
LQNQKEDLAILQEKYNNSQNYNNRLQGYKDAVDDANADKKAADKAVTAADKAKTEAITAVTDAGTAYDDSKKMVELLTSADSLASLKAESQSLDTQIEKASAEETVIDDNKKELETTAADTVSDSAINSLENAVTKLQNELAVLKEKDSATSEVVIMKLDIINQKIAEKQADIDKIKSGDNTVEVKAPIAGVINSIKVIAGDKIQLNDQLAEIQLVDKGYSISFTVTTEQAKRIKSGDAANIQNWWGNTVNAVVESIIPDTANPAQNKIVTLNVTGDVSVGTNLSFTLGEKSMDYESVIPNSAVREDNNGKFVLIVEAKSTPLGNRYTARRMEIEVIASDDTSSAVSGITYGDYVITASAEPVIAGKQVRLIES